MTDERNTIQIIIETPKGSGQKYNYDPATGFFRLKKLLPLGMVFPFDFGFIPQTKGEDGDPLDVLLLSELGSFPGCMVDCKLIGAISALQQEGRKKKIRNDRFIAVSKDSLVFAHINKLADVPKELLSALEAFFIQYNKLEGKIFTVNKHLGIKQSLQLLKRSGML